MPELPHGVSVQDSERNVNDITPCLVFCSTFTHGFIMVILTSSNCIISRAIEVDGVHSPKSSVNGIPYETNEACSFIAKAGAEGEDDYNGAYQIRRSIEPEP